MVKDEKTIITHKIIVKRQNYFIFFGYQIKIKSACLIYTKNIRL